MTNRSDDTVNDVIEIGDLILESGEVLNDVKIAYQRAGSSEAPAILACHALTGNQYCVTSDKGDGWWCGLIGKEKYIDLNKFQVITSNVLGGCEGSTGPLSINRQTGEKYGANFPLITIRDMVHAQKKMLDILGIHQLKAVIGGSLGGMQVLEWGLMYPDFMENLVPIAVTPFLSDYAIGYNTIGRLAIVSDPAWKEGRYEAGDAPDTGLRIARMIGMLTYRSGALFNHRFGREQHSEWENIHDKASFSVESYLHYQGEKLADRFDANSYLLLLKAMDTHDIGRGRGGVSEAVKGYDANILSFGFTHDLLYPPHSMERFIQEIATTHPRTEFQIIETWFGHDGFLTEFEKWGGSLEEFLAKKTIKT